MKPNILLGIDLGTSSCKSILLDPRGNCLGVATQEYAIQTPQPGWAEQDPNEWIRAAASTIHRVIDLAAVDPKQICAIGLTGQMHSLVCLDQHRQVLRPAILWADQRSALEVQQVLRQIGRQRLGQWTGNPVATGFMLVSWLWLSKHEPEVAHKTHLLLLPKDYLRCWLTGLTGSEPSDASSTLLFDPIHRTWSSELLQALGISVHLLPDIFPSWEIAGGLTPEAARQTGLLAGTPVVFGSSDQSAQGFAQGILDPGTVSCTIGTGGQLFAALNHPVYDPDLRLHLFCHAVPERWHLEAAILSAGLSLRWLRDQIFPGGSYQVLADAATQVPAGADGLFFTPYLNGERTPHMDTQARASFTGLSYTHTWKHMVRSVMEGVVYGLRQGLEIMQTCQVPVERLVASGGGTQHPLWLQLQADIFNRPVYTNHIQDATPRGAALLAGVGAGVFTDAWQAWALTAPDPGDPILPNPDRVSLYQKGYQTYCQIYPALHQI